MERLLTAVRATLFKLAALPAPKREHRGVRLLFLAPGRLSETIFFSRVSEAIDLIAEHDPRRAGRVAHDLRSIALVPAGGEYFDPAYWAYLMDVPTVEGRAVTDLALKIVHEGTHARLERLRISHKRFGRERIERLCVAQEVAFALRLPDGDGVARRAQEKLQRPWWEEKQLSDRVEDQVVSYGVPRWLVRGWRALVAGRGGSATR